MDNIYGEVFWWSLNVFSQDSGYLGQIKIMGVRVTNLSYSPGTEGHS